jgi:thiol-disulfide isomerase/thioredoxin
MKVLKFGAVWCPECIIMKPRWKEIEDENPWLQTEFYDVDNDAEVAKEHKVTDKIPAFIFLDKENKEILRLHGDVPKDELVKKINELKDK